VEMVVDVVEKQLPISDAGKTVLIKIRTGIFAELSDGLSEDVYTGKISIGQWEESMKRAIRELHSSVAAIGKGGWDKMTWADWGRLGPVMKDQYRYLHGFAEAIAANKESISIDAIKARARMYGNAGGFSSIVVQAGDVFATKLPWLPKDGSTECFFWSDKVNVYTKERGYIRLASVVVGDHVLSHKGKFRKVIANNSMYVHDINSVELALKAGKRNVKMCTTPDHLFMDDSGSWIRADSITVDTKLMRSGVKCAREGCNNIIYMSNRANYWYCSSSCASIGGKKWIAAHEKHRELSATGQQILQRLHKDESWKKYYKRVSTKSLRAYAKYRTGKTYEELYDAETVKHAKRKLAIAWKKRMHTYDYTSRTKPELRMASLLAELEIPYKEQVWMLGKYRVDFLLPDYKTVVEVDGKYWHGSEEAQLKDNVRDQEIIDNHGYDIVRFDADDVMKYPNFVKDWFVRSFSNHDGKYINVADVCVEKVERKIRNGTIQCLVVDKDESFAVTGGIISHNCLVGCKCYWELIVIGEDKEWKTVQATWRLRPAEHCDDCIDRRDHVEVIQVHISVEVPPTIG